jgi:hypothetical protein
MKIHIPLLLLTLAVTSLQAQVNVKDSAITAPIIYATYSYQFPGGDLADRFGSNSSIGGGFLVKTSGNWLIGAEGNYLFGGTVNDQQTMLVLISNPEGQIIDANGMYADIVLYERGFSFYGYFGKLIPVLSPNPNSGFTVTAGAGYLQNKIRVHNPNNTAPQVLGDYKKGYDKLNGGFALSGSIGYTYLSNSRLTNFSVNFEFIQAWTKRMRDYNFDLKGPDPDSYSSQFYGIKVCWFIPLYKRKPKDFYLY